MTIKLELFYSPYCSRCRKARKAVQSFAAAWPADRLHYRELDVLEELERAVTLGVMQTPALAIDDVLVAGPLPSTKALEDLLLHRLKTASSSHAADS